MTITKTFHKATAASILLTATWCNPALADREPVLKQIDVPHHYYFREMYLPQLTAGPGSLAWSPDGRSLVYSMQGSLWRQSLDSGVAVQLTAGPGYDYQPDWSPDGSRIVFTRYVDDAVEMQVLDVGSGEVTALTSDGAVNLEPRWSPDGSRILFVSTRDTGRFHVFTGSIIEDRLDAEPVFAERQSEISRYYYSRFDHELSPAWSPDGESIVYVANPETPYGTGSIWRKRLDSDAPPVLVRQEETSWRARPDWAPDGRRIAYASYLGRQWHQLWITSVEGKAEPFPLTYGDFDISGPRFSPDGKRIAYVVNEGGGTEIRVQELLGGRVMTVAPETKEFLVPMAQIGIAVTNRRGEPIDARMSVTGSDGRSYAPDQAWIHADDGFDRDDSDYEARYFHVSGPVTVDVPPGATRITAWHGPEYEIETILINALTDAANAVSIEMTSLDLPDEWRDWQSADVHVHMNYGGTYRNTPANLVRQASAEDLDVVFNLIVNKEQRIPDIRYFSPEPDSASTPDVLLVHAQEFHTSFWGHLGLIGLESHLLLPDYAAYPETAAASLFPDNATASRLAREQGAAVGYVHPFEPPAPDPGAGRPLTNALPVDAALGLVDYYEVVGFADPHTSASVWYGLLNCGLRIAAAGGTDAMANYASLRGPVGQNRTYVRVADRPADPAMRKAGWLAALKAQRSFATNAPLVGLTVAGHGPGEVVELAGGGHRLPVRGFLRSQVPIDRLQLVRDGSVVEEIALGKDGRSVDFESTVAIDRSGWLMLRAWNESSHPQVFDLYPYATTSPVYVSVDGQPPRSPDDAAYFTAWIDRIRSAVESHPDYNSEEERLTILGNLDAAETRFEACR